MEKQIAIGSMQIARLWKRLRAAWLHVAEMSGLTVALVHWTHKAEAYVALKTDPIAANF